MAASKRISLELCNLEDVEGSPSPKEHILESIKDAAAKVTECKDKVVPHLSGHKKKVGGREGDQRESLPQKSKCYRK